MTASQWSKKIKKSMEDYYDKKFDHVIAETADILERRDAVYSEWGEIGFPPVIDKVSDRGAVNSAKHPLAQVWQDLNKQALEHWKELGLTPLTMKKIDESKKEESAGSALVAALKAIG